MADEETAVATVDAPEAKYKMTLTVDIQDVGPCRKHVRVKVARADIDFFRKEAAADVSGTAAVPGFRVGHVPASLIERRFKKEIGDQVRQRVLLTSLEQMADDHALDPINEPDFDVETLIIPDTGDFEYEFDVEVRPDFELPTYSGLKIQRPTKTVSDEDVAAYQAQFLGQYGTLTAKEEPAVAGDFVTIDLQFTHKGEQLRKMSDLTVQLKSTLQFPDGQLAGFDTLLTGATAGTIKTAQVTITPEAEAIEKRGETVDVRITVNAVKTSRNPELNKEFLDRLGMESEEDLQDQIRSMLHRQVTFEQRQTTRKQVLEQITASATWELPEELVRKQVDNALRREILEMQQAGFTTQQIQARQNELRQKSVSTTRQALKEHFVLDKIATKENIEVTPIDIESEIQMMALQRGENPRRVRARLVKSGMIENLEAQVRERKAVDFILKSAVYEDVPLKNDRDDSIEAVSLSICSAAVPADNGAETDEEA